MCFILVDINTLKPLWHFIDSNFFSSLICGGIGTCVGAYFAYKLSRDFEEKKEISKKDKQLKNMFFQSIDMLDYYINIKRDAIYTEYSTYISNMINFIISENNGFSNINFIKQYNKMNNIDNLASEFIEKFSTSITDMHTLHLVSTIRICVNEINFLINSTDHEIREIEKFESDAEKIKDVIIKQLKIKEYIYRYYGFKLYDGSKFSGFSDIMYGLNMYINKCISSSFLLSDYLYNKVYKKGNTFNFSEKIKDIPITFFYDVMKTCPDFKDKFEEIRKFRMS